MALMDILLLLAVGRCLGAEASPAPAAAVLSLRTGPYQEALAGLREELGEDVPVFVLAQGEPLIPDSTKVVVAFGSKAALRSYPDLTALVYVMAPGTVISAGNAVKISMEPDSLSLLADLKKIQPGLKRLGVLWLSPGFVEHVDQLRKAGAGAAPALESVALRTAADIPGQLRRLHGRVDALWLPPDPLLLNAATFPIFVEFSRSNKIPLFVTTEGLVEEGATASVGPSFREMGRMAGIAARKALAQEAQERRLYSSHPIMVVNKTVAEQMGLRLSADVLRQADRVLP